MLNCECCCYEEEEEYQVFNDVEEVKFFFIFCICLVINLGVFDYIRYFGLVCDCIFDGCLEWEEQFIYGIIVFEIVELVGELIWGCVDVVVLLVIIIRSERGVVEYDGVEVWCRFLVIDRVFFVEFVQDVGFFCIVEVKDVVFVQGFCDCVEDVFKIRCRIFFI